MKFALILVMMQILGIASAETISVGDYNITFDYNKPHETVVISNETAILKTFDGAVYFTMGRIYDLIDGELVTVSGYQGLLYHGPNAFGFVNEQDPQFMVEGDLPYYDSADFLRSLRIEKVKAS